ncbi:hypothetical protein [Kangiella sp. HZ709]|uniref:hypothetical protein n=1 Tax=Kangiella sp. HZ709 TaxID=2666328 RepID=UPI0012AFE419|nr:hypothetical protein [Kangiella sp. HZ709]MRX28633.1 hypothetical protein [Kangiella sp. HZ709]
MRRIILIIITLNLFACSTTTDVSYRCSLQSSESWTYISDRRELTEEIKRDVGQENFKPSSSYDDLWYKNEEGKFAYCKSSKSKNKHFDRACYSSQIYIEKKNNKWEIYDESIILCGSH